MRQTKRLLLCTALCVGVLAPLSGCGNEANEVLDLGSVSIGDQLIDLQKAYKAGAIDQQEYAAAKAALLTRLAQSDDDDDDDDEVHIEIDLDDEDGAAKADDEDESGFIF